MKKLLLSLILIVSFSSLTFAITFVVNSTGDTFDANTADNICADSLGNCTLRAAIQQAKPSQSEYIIEFSASVFSTPQTITLTNGTLELGRTGKIIINGSGADLLKISGNNQSRIFYFSEGAVVDINNVTLTKGNGVHPFLPNYGGAISNNGGTITLFNTTVTGNIGGSSGRSGGSGGGIYNYAGTMTLTNSTVSNNIGNFGGGICNYSATLTLTNSTIVNNSGINGGGIASLSNLTVTNSTIANNNAVQAGGIYVIARDTSTKSYITNSTISGNTATGDSIYDGYGGGIWSRSATLIINNATITNNSGTSFESKGGGIVKCSK